LKPRKRHKRIIGGPDELVGDARAFPYRADSPEATEARVRAVLGKLEADPTLSRSEVQQRVYNLACFKVCGQDRAAQFDAIWKAIENRRREARSVGQNFP
jgi:hypothetical protein